MKTFAVGFTGVANGAFEPEFRAPKNYKDAKKISDYIADARAEYIQTCSRVPYCSVPSRIVILDVDGKVVKTWEPGKTFDAESLCKVLIDFYVFWEYEVNREGVLVLGFELEHLLMGVATILLSNNVKVDSGFWIDVRCDLRDVFKTITNGTVRQWLDLQDVCNYFGYSDPEVMNTAHGQAGAALHLGRKVFNV